MSALHHGSTPGLPHHVTAYVGRERELDALSRLLLRDDTRLLTLTGPGGVGKTRLALHVAQTVAVDFRDGVWFVPLAAVRSAELVLSAIAQALNVRQTSGQTLVQGVTSALGDKRALLIVDNFEHVVEAAPEIVSMLLACPTLKCMATSRTLLHVSGEHAFPVPPLPVPPVFRETTAHRASQSAAVQLFVDRAQAVRPDFHLADSNAAEIESICRRFDGLPLAIELAAARVRHLSLSELMDQTTQQSPGSSLRLLSEGPRDAPDRHRGLHRAIGWSHDLLSPEERTLFRRLGLFIGGFTSAAARAVAQVNGGPGIDIDRGIASLVDQSLLWREASFVGDSRFGMLETIREFALEQLASHPDEERATREAHADYYLSLAELAAPRIHQDGQREWLERLDADHANLRLALTWFEQSGRPAELTRLAWALFWFWWLRGHLWEGKSWYQRAIALDTASATSTRAPALFGAAQCAEALTDVAHVESLAREGLELMQEPGQSFIPGVFEFMLSLCAFWRADVVEALKLGETALSRLRSAESWEGDLWLRIALNDIGLHLAHAGHGARGIALLEDAIALAPSNGDQLVAGIHWSDLGLAAQAAGDNVRAVRAFRRGLSLLQSAGGEWYLSVSLAGLATSAAQSDPSRAARLLGAAEALRRKSGQPNWPIEKDRDERTVATLRLLLGDEAFERERENGRVAPPPETVELALDSYDRPRETAMMSSPPGDRLSPRELDVLRLLVAGRSDREIADALFISPRTASKHVGSILAKLGVTSRSKAVERAIREQLA